MTDWIDAKINPPKSHGVYWVQSRGELAHLEVRYHSSYWNGWRWTLEPGSAVYWYAVIEQAEEPENPHYYDELGRLDIVPAQERGVDLQTPLGK